MNWAIVKGGTTAHRFAVRRAPGGEVFESLCGAIAGDGCVHAPGDCDHCAACEELDDVPGIGRSFAQAFMPGAMAFAVRK